MCLVISISLQHLLQNISKLKRILSSEKLVDAASDNGDKPSLKIILKKCASHLDIDTRDENGATPLILAALNGHRNVVLSLLSYSASVGAVDNQG